MADTDTKSEILQARQTFAATLNGAPVVVHKGDTIRAGHPLLKKREQLFGPVHPRFDHLRDTEAAKQGAVVLKQRAKERAEAAARAEADAVAAQEKETIDQLLAEVGDDREKAAAALEHEKAGKQRVTLIEALEAILAEKEPVTSAGDAEAPGLTLETAGAVVPEGKKG